VALRASRSKLRKYWRLLSNAVGAAAMQVLRS
jgi:hypothetical protein